MHLDDPERGDDVEPADDDAADAFLAGKELADEDIPDEDLEDEFPLGDGTAEQSAVVYCPYCSEPVEITLDPGSGTEQEYVEDCEVCCRPWQVNVTYDRAGNVHVNVANLDD